MVPRSARGCGDFSGRTGSFQFGCELRARRRGPQVPPPAPTSPFFGNSRAPTVPLPGGGVRECCSGPREQAARLLLVSSFTPFPAAAAASALSEAMGAAGLSQHPRPGARAHRPLRSGGPRGSHRCTAPTPRGARDSTGTRTFREYLTLIPKSPTPESLNSADAAQETLVMNRPGDKAVCGILGVSKPAGGCSLGFLVSTSDPQDPFGTYTGRQRPYCQNPPC